MKATLNSAKLSKRTKEKVKQMTRNCYHLSIIEVMNSLSIDNELKSDFMAEMNYYQRIASLMQQQFVDENLLISSSMGGDPESKMTWLQAQAYVSSRYLERILEHSTKDLQHLIDAHNDDYIRRSPKVFEAVLNELTRRGLLNDFT